MAASAFETYLTTLMALSRLICAVKKLLTVSFRFSTHFIFCSSNGVNFSFILINC